jgi:hypothetical protein
MNILWDAYKSISGKVNTNVSERPEDLSNKRHRTLSEDEIALLCDRLLTSTLPDDRKQALQTLAFIAPYQPYEVGSFGFKGFIALLQTEYEDEAICLCVLQALSEIFSPFKLSDPRPNDLPTPQKYTVSSDKLSLLHSQFLETGSSIEALLSLVESNNSNIRFYCVQVVRSLLEIAKESTQESILSIPRGMQRIIDLLGDTQDHVLSESLCLLELLTSANSTVQKLAVYENIFDQLFSIMVREGWVFPSFRFPEFSAVRRILWWRNAG